MPGASKSGQGAILWDLVEESFDEAEFLWHRWEDGLVSHSRDLAGTAFWIEERLDGSLEGIRVGGDAAFEPLIAPALASDQPWRLAVAAHVAATGESEQAKQVLSIMIGAARGARLATLRRAVELVPQSGTVAAIERTLAKGGLEQKAALLSMRAFRHQPPGSEFKEVLGADAPEIKAVALASTRYLEPGQGLPIVESALGESAISPRNAALESALVLGSRAAWSRCLDLVRAQGPGIGGLLTIVAQLGTEREHALVLAVLANANKELRRDALFAAGFAGTLQAADACVDAMRDAADAKVAAESFCAITGLGLQAERLIDAEPPRPEEPIPFEQEDLDADLVPTPDELLPAPNVAGVLSWWKAHRKRFADGVRYLGGQAVTMRGLQNILETGPMRRRHATALELSIRTQGRYNVATRAFTAVQRQQMLAFDTVLATRLPLSPLGRSIAAI